MTVLALVTHQARAAFEEKAALNGLEMAMVESVSELSAQANTGTIFSVAILPATLPDGGIWSLWGQVQLLNPRPEILVYGPSGDFATWSGVLESGGHDILVEPFTAEELRSAVTRAERAFNQRLSSGTEESNA